MMQSSRSIILAILAASTLVLGVIKAAGGFSARDPSPRDIAARFLAAAGVDQGAAKPPREPTQALFTDVAPAMGIRFIHDNAARGNYFLPEEMGPGAGFLDYDGDGDLDVFVAAGGAIIDDGPAQTCRLYRNDGDRFTDVTEAANVAVAGPAYGVACADYDDDGDVDIFISRLGPNALLRNEGDGRFTEVAHEAGVADVGFGAGAAFFDYDRDGRLDLYLSNYVAWNVQGEAMCYTVLGIRDYCSPTVYKAPSRDKLYRNVGAGRFEDVSESAGIATEVGNGLSVLASDFDGDGWCDVYVANDQTPAFLWHNNGDGTFENVAALNGCAYNGRGAAIAGMGVVCEDFDSDGDFDLLVTNIRGQMHLALQNEGGFFEDISLRMGIATWSMPATTFGVALLDQDNDGRLDGLFANGEVNVTNALPVGANPYAQPDHFVRLLQGSFVDVTEASGAAFGDVGRGVACADYDNDGDLDLLVTNNGGPLRLLRNNNDTSNTWLVVDARTGPGGRTAIGARVAVTVGNHTFYREVRPQQSYLSSGDPRAHFGLGRAAQVDQLEVLWPDGSRSLRTNLPVNQFLRIEPNSEASRGSP